MKKKLLIWLASLVVLGIIVGIIVLTTAPTEFELSNLSVSPAEVEPWETVTVTVEVRNVGEEKGTYELELIIDGLVEQSESVTLDGGETTSISFSVEKDIEGSYSVELAGLTGIFQVVEPEPTPKQGTLTVHFIDVGQGDSILLDFGDIEVLIDGGDKSPGVVSYIDDYVDGPLEVMVATHPHADHIGGLIAVLGAFEVDEIWLNGDTSTSKTYSQFMSAVNSEGARVFVARRGDAIQADNLTFDVLHPVNLSGTTNDNSIVLSLSYGQVDFLFTGDAEQEAEASMLTESIVPDVEVLKVGHHGSRTASSIQLLQVAQPECAIYMAEQGNSYGHPHQETIINLCEVGAEIYGTDIHGTITIMTDGATYNVLPSNNVPPIVPPNPTTVGGVLSGDVVWTMCESPYILTGHILVPKGSKLTMEPGVQVNLGDRFIQVEGTLQVLGTLGQPVKITGPANTSHSKIIFKPNSTNWDEDTQSGSIIRNATIEGQTYGSSLIKIEGSSPKIVDSIIINDNPSGGAINSREGSPKIISNIISAYYGIAVAIGSPQIIGNRIERENSFSGVSVSLRHMGELGEVKSHVRIEGNLITGFEYGVLIQAFNDDDQIDITSNHITNNQVGILTGIYEGTSLSPPLSIRMNAIHNNPQNAKAGSAQGKAYNIDMSNNWWGTTDNAAIETTLYHYPQDFRLAHIIYEPFLIELPSDVPLP